MALSKKIHFLKVFEASYLFKFFLIPNCFMKIMHGHSDNQI